MPPPTTSHHHPPPPLTIHHHAPPAKIYPTPSTTTHKHPPPSNTTQHQPKYIHHHPPTPKKWTTTHQKPNIFTYNILLPLFSQFLFLRYTIFLFVTETLCDKVLISSFFKLEISTTFYRI